MLGDVAQNMHVTATSTYDGGSRWTHTTSLVKTTMEHDLYLVRWRLQALGLSDVCKCRSDVMHDNLDWTARRGCRRKRGGRRTIVIQCSGGKET